MFDSIAWLMELCRLTQYRKEAGMVIEDINFDRKRIADLEAELAAARALLLEMRNASFIAWQLSREGREYIARIDAALAAAPGSKT